MRIQCMQKRKRYGYATEAVAAFLPIIMARRSIAEIAGVCHGENMASRRVLEKCGFEWVCDRVEDDPPGRRVYRRGVKPLPL